MVKRIMALFCALLLLVTCTFSTFALIAVEDENGVIHYSTDKEPTKAEKAKTAVKEWFEKGLERAKNFWQRRGVLTVVILLVVGILGMVVVLTVEDEKKKKEEAEKRPKKNHKD